MQEIGCDHRIFAEDAQIGKRIEPAPIGSIKIAGEHRIVSVIDVPGFFAAAPDVELKAARGGVGILDALEGDVRLHG